MERRKSPNLCPESMPKHISIKTLILTVLLVFVPISIAAELMHWGDLAIFVTAGLAILPLAAWMGTATEEIAVVVGPSLGGLLNATFGNATELIIALVALKAGAVDVVKASLAGSIVGNLLLVLGFSMFLGGLRYKEQTFQPTIARLNASSMNLAVIAILMPTAVNYTSTGMAEATLQQMSVVVSIAMIVVYLFTLFFSMKTHSYLYDVGVEVEEDGGFAAAGKKPNIWIWVSVLLLITLLVAIESELLVGALSEATNQLGLTELFTGIILLPVIGNAAEHATAVVVALKDKMDLSMSVALGSSLQIALFVAPVLVIAGWFLGQPMDLNFNPFELVTMLVAVAVANSVSADGSSNWLEGMLLLATYFVIGTAFFFHPALT
jgi:Ca2+:H+ antiporter